MEITNTHEFLIKTAGLSLVANFIETEIGVEFEKNRGEQFDSDCSITVFDLTPNEHLKIRKYISKKNYWSK